MAQREILYNKYIWGQKFTGFCMENNAEINK